MDRTFETTIDSDGHLDLPQELRDRHGLSNGVRVRIEERDNDLVVSKLERRSRPVEQAAAKRAIVEAIGALGTSGRGLSDLMEQRKRDSDKEEHELGS